MDLKNKKAKQAKEIIDGFSEFIRTQIRLINPNRSGIDVDDISQEVKLKLWKMLLNEKKITYYSSFIKRVIYSTLIDKMRRIKREKEIISNYYNPGKYKNTPSDISHEEEVKEIIGQSVDSLIESRRKVVKLYLLEMDSNEISDFFGWSKDKVRNLLYRGLTDLKNILKEKGINYERNKQ